MIKKLFTNKWFYITLIAFIFLISLGDTKTPPPELPSDDSYLEELKSTNHNAMKKGDRKLGIGISEGGVGFEEAFANAEDLGVEVVEIVSNWDDGEKKPNQYSDEWLEIANSYYPSRDISLSLSVNPIDTNNLRLPDHLKGLAFNDSRVVEGYKSYITYLASLLSDTRVESVSVGNEVSATLGKSKKKWEEYTEFFCNVAPHIRAEFPQAVVGVKVPLRDIVGDMKNEVKALNECSDAVLTTYYPLSEKFIVYSPTIVHHDFKEITDLYPSRKIHFSEIGYPSGDVNGSSEEKQALFFQEALVAWDLHQDSIEFLNIIWLHDISSSKLNSYKKYYDSSNPAFLSYLGTLGIRTHDGEAKKAYDTLEIELSARGW